jgi:hypothetical protein
MVDTQASLRGLLVPVLVIAITRSFYVGHCLVIPLSLSLSLGATVEGVWVSHEHTVDQSVHFSNYRTYQLKSTTTTTEAVRQLGLTTHSRILIPYRRTRFIFALIMLHTADDYHYDYSKSTTVHGTILLRARTYFNCAVQVANTWLTKGLFEPHTHTGRMTG